MPAPLWAWRRWENGKVVKGLEQVGMGAGSYKGISRIT